MNHYSPEFKEAFDINDQSVKYNRPRFLRYIEARGCEIYGKDFFVTPKLAMLYEIILGYAVNNNQKMALHGIDPRKGLLVMGPLGSGKTALLHLMKVFFPRKSQYVLHNTSKLSIDFACKGYESVQAIFADNSRPICLDNMGKESQAKYYGHNTEIVMDIVEHFYERRFDQKYPRLHITTSLSAVEIEQRYGVEFRKQLKALFNVLVVDI